MNKALNATVALIEGRTSIAKEIIRAPGSDVHNVPEILVRLNQAVDRAAAKAMRNALIQTLSIRPNMMVVNGNLSAEEAFYLGVSQVEEMLEQVIERLDNQSNSVNYVEE
jgi:CRISPR/Cas system-associated protein Csm6